jgi:hypothetical protein
MLGMQGRVDFLSTICRYTQYILHMGKHVLSSSVAFVKSYEVCRDGSVFSSISLEDLKQPERLYQKLGCKLAVGMPFKDIASTDTLFMRELPPESDKVGRTALHRLQEVGMHVIVPIDHLRTNPMENAIALVDLAQAQTVQLPEGCKRCVYSHYQQLGALVDCKRA